AKDQRRQNPAARATRREEGCMKRFGKDRDASESARSGPRARAAQDRKFGAPRSASNRGSADRGDPYQRAERPARASYGERMRMPARTGGIELDPDVARVFRDSEAVNEALRLVIRLARTISGGGRPAFDRPRPTSSRGAPARRSDLPPPRRFGPADRANRAARNEPTERREPSRDPRFDDAE
ncbi:MAG: hypothetical protein ACRECQ_14010, partial [Burkholderiaceae bacterium]